MYENFSIFAALKQFKMKKTFIIANKTESGSSNAPNAKTVRYNSVLFAFFI
jgi:hypothetical protein